MFPFLNFLLHFSRGTCCRCVTCKHHSTHFLLSQCPSLLNLITHALVLYSITIWFYFHNLILILITATAFHSKDIHKYNTFSSLSPDLSQRIFNNLVYSSYLTPASLQPFRDSALQVTILNSFSCVPSSLIYVIWFWFSLQVLLLLLLLLLLCCCCCCCFIG